jgi:aminopeptidase N
VDSVKDISVVQTLLRQAGTAVRRYAAPGWRDEGLALMASCLRSLLTAAEPGSDKQLAYAREFASAATSPADVELLSSLLSGSSAIEGLAVDTDLRWALLFRLASRGAVGEAEIDAELSSDATDAGERHAATCRAALPTPGNKRETWETLVSGKLTIAMFRAVLGGFADRDQAELTASYRTQYFSAITGAWRDWSSAIAIDFVEGAYQVCPVEQETITVTDSYLASAEPPAALRRLLLEGRDDIERSLRCQARDATAE